MNDQSHAAREGVELGPFEPICAGSERAKLTAYRLEVLPMQMEVLDMKRASVS